MTDRKPIVISATGGPAEMPAGDLLPVSVQPIDKYRMMQAINANATTGTTSGGGVDAMFAFISSPNYGNAAFLAFHMAPWEVVSGNFENLVLSPWLSGSTSATPPGLGLSTTSSPTLANVLAALRTSAASQTS